MPARMPTPRPAASPRHGYATRAFRFETIGVGLAGLVAACGTPAVRGVMGTAPAPNVAWTAPRQPPNTAPPAPAPLPSLPPDIAERVAQLRLTDILDIALRNNTATAAAWADARAAAASYGAARGQYYPTLTLSGNAQALKTVPSTVPVSLTRQFYAATVTTSWLLVDFGGRSGSVSAAREALLAADWTHNATLQSVVLAAEQAYFDYLAAKALLAAQQTSFKEAETNLDAAQQRHAVGLATIADVLQAKTARSQSQLALEATEGQLQTTRGALALSMGVPATVPYDISPPSDTTIPLGITDSIDTLIARAVRERPDLAAARAQVAAAQARVSVARSQALPSLSVGGNAGETYFLSSSTSGNSYTGSVTLSIPLFSGGAQIYNVRAAAAAADAAAERARGLEQQVIYQVFTAYYALRTTTQQVRTSADLLASATQSAQVALGRYRAGAGSLLDLLTAEAAVANARAQAIAARFSWSIAVAQLARDAGILGLDGASPLHLRTDSAGPTRER